MVDHDRIRAVRSHVLDVIRKQEPVKTHKIAADVALAQLGTPIHNHAFTMLVDRAIQYHRRQGAITFDPKQGWSIKK